MNCKLRNIIACGLICSLIISDTAYAVVKDNVGGMDTSPATGTEGITKETVLEGSSGWVNGRCIIGQICN